MIKLFIFDLDGVLTSTSNEHFSAWKQVVKEKLHIDVEDYVEEKTKGVSRIQSLNRILETYHVSLPKEDIELMAFEKNEIYKRLINNFSERNVFNGVIKIFEYLKKNHIKIALGSASKNGPTLIRKLGIETYFDFVVDPSSLPSKPHPDIFLNAMEHFHLTPSECVGVEDAVSGVKAIKAAGMTAIGIGDPKILHQADFVFDSLDTIKMDFLEHLIR
jgi:beta-phosphoglucomutase